LVHAKTLIGTKQRTDIIHNNGFMGGRSFQAFARKSHGPEALAKFSRYRE
jgi:hypothetical protein